METKLISITVEFDRGMPDDDVAWHAAKVKRTLHEWFPDAAVRVKPSYYNEWTIGKDAA